MWHLAAIARPVHVLVRITAVHLVMVDVLGAFLFLQGKKFSRSEEHMVVHSDISDGLLQHFDGSVKHYCNSIAKALELQ